MVSKSTLFALSLSRDRSVVHGSTSSPRTVSIDLLDTLLRHHIDRVMSGLPHQSH